MKLFFKKIGVLIISLILILTFILFFIISEFLTEGEFEIEVLSY